MEPLIIVLLIIAAIGVQVLAFFVTLRIRRNAALKEDNVLTEAQVQESFNE